MSLCAALNWKLCCSRGNTDSSKEHQDIVLAAYHNCSSATSKAGERKVSFQYNQPASQVLPEVLFLVHLIFFQWIMLRVTKLQSSVQIWVGIFALVNQTAEVLCHM